MTVADPKERRFRLIVFTAIGVLAVGWVVAAEMNEKDDKPTLADLRRNAEVACQRFIAMALDPLDVDFRDRGSAFVTGDGEKFKVTDRMAVGGDLAPYACDLRLDAEGWHLVDIDMD